LWKGLNTAQHVESLKLKNKITRSFLPLKLMAYEFDDVCQPPKQLI
jgi:hypothetical protein